MLGEMPLGGSDGSDVAMHEINQNGSEAATTIQNEDE
jgi:hypothetical protein